MLKGKRVTLRATRREEMEIVHQFGQDLELEILGGGDPPHPQTLEAVQSFYDEHTTKEKQGGFFTIIADEKVIGFAGIFNFNSTNRNCDLGIGIGDRDYLSKGYGRETIGLLLDYAFTHRNLNRVHLATHNENPRAIACYLASGFVEEGRLRSHVWSAGKFVDEVHMGVLRDEWRAGRS